MSNATTQPPDRTRLDSAALRSARLLERQSLLRQQRAQAQAGLGEARAFLASADEVSDALDTLSQQLFGQIVELIESRLTVALQEVLEQPIALKVERGFSHGGVTLRFSINRAGKEEDIVNGQGGSVANVLSVGLRLFALTTLPIEQHRRFLVLDEQDCWLRPDLVPRLVRIVHAAGKALGFQVLMISHHDRGVFERYADRVYSFAPGAEGVEARLIKHEAPELDVEQEKP